MSYSIEGEIDWAFKKMSSVRSIRKEVETLRAKTVTVRRSHRKYVRLAR